MLRLAEPHRRAVPAQVAEGPQPGAHQRTVDQRRGPKGECGSRRKHTVTLGLNRLCSNSAAAVAHVFVTQRATFAASSVVAFERVARELCFQLSANVMISKVAKVALETP